MAGSSRARPFARRVDDIEPFRVVEVLARATELARAGRDIVHLAAGEPDFATAAPTTRRLPASLNCARRCRRITSRTMAWTSRPLGSW